MLLPEMLFVSLSPPFLVCCTSSTRTKYLGAPSCTVPQYMWALSQVFFQFFSADPKDICLYHGKDIRTFALALETEVVRWLQSIHV